MTHDVALPSQSSSALRNRIATHSLLSKASNVFLNTTFNHGLVSQLIEQIKPQRTVFGAIQGEAV